MEAARAMPAPAATRLETKRSNGLALPTPSAAEPERAVEQLELPPGPRVSGSTLATLAAIAGMGAIALGAWAFVSSVRADDSTDVAARSVPIYGAAQAISLLAKPGTVRLPFAGADGRAVLVIGSNGRGMLVLDGLGIAPVGRTYQAWVLTTKARPAAPLSAALFSGVETIVPLSARIEPGSVVGITVERTGGARAPTQALRYVAQRPAATR
jgi:Anti-sigma-K factor rskA